MSSEFLWKVITSQEVEVIQDLYRNILIHIYKSNDNYFRQKKVDPDG